MLALIDEAVEDWTVSRDAMRWTPAWNEPIVRSPQTPVEHLTHAGWDGYAAHAYPPIAIRQIARVLAEAMENLSHAFRKLMPVVANAKARPAPFWTVQPQWQRRKR